MAKSYDTGFLRLSAQAVEEAAGSIASSVKTNLQWIKEDAPEQLAGSSAEAIESMAAELEEHMIRCCKSLEDVGSSLRKYAFMLDEADAKAAQMIANV